jgi:Family of unknown function (DUF5692)
MLSILTVAVFLLFYVSAQELVRRSPLCWTWGLFAFVPVVLTNYWIRVNDFGPFLWIKLYSVMFCICWATWLRTKTCGSKLQSTISLLLLANVIEATVVDLCEDGLAHSINAVSGMILILTLPPAARRTSVDQQLGYRDLHVNISRHWIVGYTLWNWTFVYLNYPHWSGHHVAVLLAALVIGLIEPKRWLQARACTLGINLLLTASCYDQTLSIFDTQDWFSPQFATGSACLSLIWLAAPLRGWRLELQAGTCRLVGLIEAQINHPHLTIPLAQRLRIASSSTARIMTEPVTICLLASETPN